MTFFDLLTALPPALPGDPSSRRSREENITGMVSMTVFPALEFIIVLLAGVEVPLWISAGLLPAAFTGATVLICRRLGTETGWTLTASLACALLCVLAGGAAFLLAALAQFYRDF
jgi:hypothetical protein